MADVSPRPNGQRERIEPIDVRDTEQTVLLHDVSWGAVFAGAALALVAQVILNMIGIGIGAGLVNPASGSADNAASSVSIGAGVWWALSGIVAAFLGGVAAGRLSGKPELSTAAWHGVTAWAATTLVVLWLATTAVSSIVGGTFQIAGNVAGQAAHGAASAATGAVASSADPFSLIESRIRGTGDDRAAQINQAIAEIRALVMSDPQQADAQRERAVQALARAQRIPPDQARQQVQQYEQQFRDISGRAQQFATRMGDTASRAVAWSAILGAIALLLGAAAGWFGGRVGAIDPTVPPLDRLQRALPPRRTA